ncbi:hypothetical protein MNBD_CPR01-146 [hydrothermal vent metagenome]|uniref:Uncharacterized protein n=1 Tax=hydrothermal vent metagenome TaxID=652676 RepID=A0A3B0UL97_9ZZZZ
MLTQKILKKKGRRAPKPVLSGNSLAVSFVNDTAPQIQDILPSVLPSITSVYVEEARSDLVGYEPIWVKGNDLATRGDGEKIFLLDSRGKIVRKTIRARTSIPFLPRKYYFDGIAHAYLDMDTVMKRLGKSARKICMAISVCKTTQAIILYTTNEEGCFMHLHKEERARKQTRLGYALAQSLSRVA